MTALAQALVEDVRHRVVTGYPAMQHAFWRRLQALIHRLPDLMQRTKDVEERVAELERQRVREGEGVR